MQEWLCPSLMRPISCQVDAVFCHFNLEVEIRLRNIKTFRHFSQSRKIESIWLLQYLQQKIKILSSSHQQQQNVANLSLSHQDWATEKAVGALKTLPEGIETKVLAVLQPAMSKAIQACVLLTETSSMSLKTNSTKTITLEASRKVIKQLV